jgi:quercetin dioxygenase-like cupin family protein
VLSRGQTYWRDCEAKTAEIDQRNVQTEILYSLGHFQIERLTFDPYGSVPTHRHPLVDSYEFPLWGSGTIVIGGHSFKLDDHWTPWKPLYVSHNTWHSGKGDERGGGFLSLQRWNGSVLGSIGMNWETPQCSTS